jgi:hypothetical protein
MDEFKSAEAYCALSSASFERKANHNKRESQFCYLMVTIATAIAPIFIAFGEGLIIGKIVPSLLSVAAAGAASWLQLRKPQQLWALYRTAQRQLEVELVNYRLQLPQYSREDRDRILIERVNTLALDVHGRWLALVPSPDNLPPPPTNAGSNGA